MTFEELKTPCYIINEEQYRISICDFMKQFESAWPGIVLFGYSVKTNHLPYLIKIAKEYGWKTEVVSPDEYELAELCGVSEKNIIYNGPQKRNTVVDSIKAGAIVNLDNLMEVQLVCSHIDDFNVNMINVGLRVNLDLEELCPGETTTGEMVGRFGICVENGDFEKALNLLKVSGISLNGLHVHSSSKSRSLKFFKTISRKTVEIIKKYNLYNIKYIDIGGGFFGGKYFPNKPSIREYANTICTEIINGLGYEKCKSIMLILEPGAAILASTMDYLVSTLNIRDIRGKRVITVDGSLLHINPMMNQHEVPCTLINPGIDTMCKQIIGGSTCMEMDRIYPRGLNKLIELDTQILFHACGAYMSTHNSSFINSAPSIYILKDNNYKILREKNIESMFKY